MSRIMLRTAVAGLAAFAGVGLAAAPALAHDSTTTTSAAGSGGGQSVTVTSPIKAGADASTVGSATFTRTAGPNDTAVVLVHGSVPNGINESHLCYSTQPFTSRVPPGQCQLSSQGNNGTVDYSVTVTGADAAKTLYFQFHVSTNQDTAYAGWQSGNPFYGNVAVEAPAGTPLPVGTLGGVGLALFAGLALVVTSRRRSAPGRPASSGVGQFGQP